MAKILVVDDEADTAEVLSWYLSDRGHEVRTASDGEAALRLAETEPPEVLIADYLLPCGPNGIELATRLRRSVPALKVVIVSGMAADNLLALIAGIQGARVLTKPLDLKSLTTLLG
ncbi:MAG TPA: response regulator [Polyangiaceae bacterium]|nr:response regulator [Polyangiaceae bacterium]